MQLYLSEPHNPAVHRTKESTLQSHLCCDVTLQSMSASAKTARLLVLNLIHVRPFSGFFTRLLFCIRAQFLTTDMKKEEVTASDRNVSRDYTGQKNT